MMKMTVRMTTKGMKVPILVRMMMVMMMGPEGPMPSPVRTPPPGPLCPSPPRDPRWGLPEVGGGWGGGPVSPPPLS